MDLTLPNCMEDSESGSLRVWTPHEPEYAAEGLLFFSVTEDHPTFETWNAGTFLDRDSIRSLRDALNTHLGEVGPATAPPTPSDQDFIRQVVHEEVARVVPLHLAPQAAGAVGIDCNALLRPGHRLADVCNNCGFTWALHRAQPEPLCSRPRPADAHAASRCTWCGHLWTEHAERTTRTRCGRCDTYNDTPIPHVCEPEPEPEPQHGRLMSELPRRVRKCIGCAHAVIDHVPPARNWDGGCLECPCDWMGPTR